MQKITPKLIIHSGAPLPGDNFDITKVGPALHEIVEEVYALLLKGSDAVEAVVKGCQLLEDNDQFNAGPTGSHHQSDSKIRMSASLMDGVAQSFSGVINVSRAKNPIELAQALQTQSDRVRSDYGKGELVNELNCPTYNPQEIESIRLEGKLPPIHESNRGTIGVVALDSQGRLAAGTSTGGKSNEDKIGRVSDSAMPAGNYANEFAAVSCTGLGEDIIDECLAARIVIRVTDGLSLKEAMERSMEESFRRKRDFAAISIAANGEIVWGKTSDFLHAAYHHGKTIGDTLKMVKQVGHIT